jgi:hypothetical protein
VCARRAGCGQGQKLWWRRRRRQRQRQQGEPGVCVEGRRRRTLSRKTERPKVHGAARSPGLNSSSSSGVANCSQTGGVAREQGTAGLAWARAGMGWGCLPHLAGLGWAGAGSGHSDLPRLAAELGQHVRGQQESRGAGWWLGCRVTQERLDERLHAKRRGAQGDRVRDGVNASLRRREIVRMVGSGLAGWKPPPGGWKLRGLTLPGPRHLVRASADALLRLPVYHHLPRCGPCLVPRPRIAYPAQLFSETQTIPVSPARIVFTWLGLG